MFDYQAVMALLKIPMVRYILLLKMVVGIPVGVFHSMFTMVNIDKFGLTAETNGHLLSYVGVITMVSIISPDPVYKAVVTCIRNLWQK